MKKLSIAFVGCGGIADHYLQVYRDLEWVEMAVCMDVNLDRANHAVAQLGENSSARATTNFADVLSDDVDVVVINSPNHLHREQAVAVLAANKHVLVQKPLAASLEDARAIAEAAAAAKLRGVISGLYMSYFDQPLMHDLKAKYEAGYFGDITHLYARLMHRGGLTLSKEILSGQQNWRGSVAQTGGGAFIQLAVHYVHLFGWMMNSDVVRVMAMTKNQHCPGIEGEDMACAILEFSNGALATLDMAWNTAGEQLSIHGTLGTAEYIGNKTLLMNSIAQSSQAEKTAAPGTAARQEVSEIIAPALGDSSNPYNQHRMFLEAVRDGREPFVSVTSGADDLRVVQAVYESAWSGRAIEIEQK